MKSREKRLLTILLTLLMLGGLLISVTTFREKRSSLIKTRSELVLQWVRIEALFEEKVIWDLRANWLSQNQPAFISNKDASQAIFNDSMAENRRGVTISKQTLLPIEEAENYIEAAINVTAGGELAAISRWLYDITSPSSFRAIRGLSISPNPEEPDKVIAKFELVRWYAPIGT